jgi:pimeloyl-ACP methyl ester carboxylesterase
VPSSAFMPPELSEITEPAARRMAERMQRAPIAVPALPGGPLPTAFVPPSGEHSDGDAPPVVLLHGFDSSSLEMRRLHPLLESEVEAWAVDLVGWGFTDHSVFASNKDLALTPAGKRAHLYAFWKEKVRRPMVLVGASLGGAIALEFALEHPEVRPRQGAGAGAGPGAAAGPQARVLARAAPRPVCAAARAALTSPPAAA